MITFKELEKFDIAGKTELAVTKRESLYENYEHEVEAKIDRSIMLTRMSNPNKLEINIQFDTDIPFECIQKVIASYEREGYSVGWAEPIPDKDYNEIVIGWDGLVGKFNEMMRNPELSSEDICNIRVATENEIYDELIHWFGKNWGSNIDKAFDYIKKEIYTDKEEPTYFIFPDINGKTHLISKLIRMPYPTGNFAIAMLDENNKVVGSITTNLKDEFPPDDYGFVDVKTLGENVTKFLETYKIAEFAGYKVKSGFYTYPLYKFNMSMIEDECEGTEW